AAALRANAVQAGAAQVVPDRAAKVQAHRSAAGDARPKHSAARASLPGLAHPRGAAGAAVSRAAAVPPEAGGAAPQAAAIEAATVEAVNDRQTGRTWSPCALKYVLVSGMEISTTRCSSISSNCVHIV